MIAFPGSGVTEYLVGQAGLLKNPVHRCRA